MTAEHQVFVRYYATRHRWVAWCACIGCRFEVRSPDENTCRINGKRHEARHR